MNFLGFPQSSSSSSSSSVDLTDVKTDILPDITNLRDVGNSTKRWRNGTFKNVTSDTFATTTGTGAQYLMANGTTLTQSAQPGQSNYYLYNNITDITAPIGGQVTYNNSAQGFAAFVYISHLTRAGVDIDVFLASVNVLNDLYIQDEADSVNFIKYNITGPPTPVVTNPGFYSIPVSMITSGGNGNSSFGSNHNILISFFSNTVEINARISLLESDTQNQTAVAGLTTFTGGLTCSASISASAMYALNFDNLNSIAVGLGVNTNNVTYIGNVSNPCYVNSSYLRADSFVKTGGFSTEFLKANGTLDSNVYVSQSGLYDPTGLGTIDIMLRDAPFIGIQYVHGSGLYSTLSNSVWSSLGVSASAGSTYATTNNFTRQLCCANWTFPSAGDGQICGYGSTAAAGVRVSTGFNFGLSAVLGISDIGYHANNCQNFWGCWNNFPVTLNQATQLSVQRNIIGFGSDTNDPNICIYTAGASSTVKQVDLGASFPANRPTVALGVSTDWFKFTLYWDLTNIYYKAVNTTTGVIVRGSFTPLAADMPAIGLILYPQCLRAMGTPNATGACRLQVQRFGVYYN
jgi:hypothetical protein